MTADLCITTPKERENLIRKLAEIEPTLLVNLEEEVVDGYKTTLARLKSAGWKLEWPLKRIYKPVRELVRKNNAD
jgi:hypothetical protein